MPRGTPLKREQVNPALVFVDRRNAAVLAQTTRRNIEDLISAWRLRPSVIAEAVEDRRDVTLLYRLSDVLRAVRLRQEER